MGKWQFWVDRGGTFTDIVGRRPTGLGDDEAPVRGPRPLRRRRGRGDRRLKAGTDAPIESVKMGTTVATNALLERKGARVLLLMTEGFGDLLRIGTQARPRLFDLAIRLPELLYDVVAEIPGRLDADRRRDRATGRSGRPVRAQSAPMPRASRSVAIAFMHSYRNPAHEAGPRRSRVRSGSTRSPPATRRAASSSWSGAATRRSWTPISLRSCAATCGRWPMRSIRARAAASGSISCNRTAG
jgi:5-oxoprolinase (ATP-hydrolysing)